jgi:hypothetical protein
VNLEYGVCSCRSWTLGVSRPFGSYACRLGVASRAFTCRKHSRVVGSSDNSRRVFMGGRKNIYKPRPGWHSSVDFPVSATHERFLCANVNTERSVDDCGIDCRARQSGRNRENKTARDANSLRLYLRSRIPRSPPPVAIPREPLRPARHRSLPRELAASACHQSLPQVPAASDSARSRRAQCGSVLRAKSHQETVNPPTGDADESR